MHYIVMGMTAALFLIIGADGANGANDESTANAPNPSPVKRESGMWKTDMTLVKVDIPGAPPQSEENMREMFSSMSGKEQCITAEHIAEEDIEKNLTNAVPLGAECTFDKKVIAGETIDIAATCKQGAQTANVVIKGTSGKTAQDIQIISTGIGSDGKTPIMIELHLRTTRTGDCA